MTAPAERDPSDARRRRREELLWQRAAERGWRERLLTRRAAQVQARKAWVRHLLER
ncbi:MAG TPA: hypothetical protein VNB94_08060 [Mycobacteriales bacterium]|nr:hypothetical protein [Mycobacteriales bacterium]